MREPEPLQQTRRTFVRWKNRTLSYFGGSDYFRLASHPAVTAALRAGLKKFGGNVSASRMTTGNHAIYAELEAALAEFFGAPAALLVSTGYLANSIAAQGLRGNFSRVILEEKAHSSLQDAGHQFRCLIQSFQRAAPDNLAAVLARAGANDKPILLTDGIFGQNGEIAPLDRYLRLLPAHGVILLDDAHGAGVLGANGRGTPEQAGVSRQRVIQTITLSKAFGVYGGAILTTRALRQKIMQSSPMFAGSTPLPPPLANAALKALEILRADPRFHERLAGNIQYAKSFLRERGLPLLMTPSPAITLYPSTRRQAVALQRRLLSRHVFPSFIHYQGGPPTGFFRFALSSEHTRRQLDDLLGALTAKEPTGANGSNLL
jgi:7-keto-8-aminopelargonate synthetase-like enzyme